MISITRYDQYWNHCVESIRSLNHSIVVATEEAFAKKIKDLTKNQFPVLVAIIPSADPRSKDVDSVIENNQALIFVLIRRPHSDKTDFNFIKDLDETQLIMKYVKELMTADKTDCEAEFHDVMKRLDVMTFHQDPEYNYIGCDGWSLSFQFDTVGF